MGRSIGKYLHRAAAILRDHYGGGAPPLVLRGGYRQAFCEFHRLEFGIDRIG